FRVSPLLVNGTWAVWRRIGKRLKGDQREDFLGVFAPLALLLILLAWALALILGYGLILHALREEIRPQPRSLGEAVYLAGVALFTIGFGDLVPVGAFSRFVVVAAAASGLAVIPLVLSLLFNLHAAF